LDIYVTASFTCALHEIMPEPVCPKFTRKFPVRFSRSAVM
jgi:hypothetical protein